MSAVSVSIRPSLSALEASAVGDDDKRLDFADFDGKNGDYQVSFRFGEHDVSYGTCFLFDYYADICQELYSMVQGLDHDIEMSGYPVACVTIGGGDEANLIIFGADNDGKPRDYKEVVSRREFIRELRLAKALIEHHVKGERR